MGGRGQPPARGEKNAGDIDGNDDAGANARVAEKIPGRRAPRLKSRGRVTVVDAPRRELSRELDGDCCRRMAAASQGQVDWHRPKSPSKVVRVQSRLPSFLLKSTRLQSLTGNLGELRSSFFRRSRSCRAAFSLGLLQGANSHAACPLTTLGTHALSGHLSAPAVFTSHRF